MAWNIKNLQTARGERFVENFILKQERNVQAKITRTILLLEKYGPFLGMPYSKKIDRKLWELRISGKEAFRIFYTVSVKEIILFHIFKKKSQKTPKKEIKLAFRRMMGLA